MKRLHLIIIAVVFVLIVRFGIVPLINQAQTSGERLCTMPNLTATLQGSLAIVGKAGGQSTLTSEYGSLYTRTIFKDITVLNNEYGKSEIVVQIAGGCDLVTGLCSMDIGMQPKSGKYYLLLLGPDNKVPSNKDVYFGSFYCNQGYSLSENPTQRSAEVEKARQAFADKDEQKWREFLEMLPPQGFDSGGVAV